VNSLAEGSRRAFIHSLPIISNVRAVAFAKKITAMRTNPICWGIHLQSFLGGLLRDGMKE